MTIHYCLEPDCENKVSEYNFKYGQGRCRSCSHKGKLNSAYKDGRRNEKHYCIEPDCNNEVCYSNWIGHGGRCIDCGNKLMSIKAVGRKRPDLSESNKQRLGKKHPRYKEERHEIYNCINCGNPILYVTWKNGSNLCSSCTQLGERNHAYTEGLGSSPYPLGWTKTFKEQIRFRDDYKCQICECPEVECKTKLHVHHIDYDKQNLDPNNLTSLCKSCHSKTNFNRGYWKEYYTKRNELVILH